MINFVKVKYDFIGLFSFTVSFNFPIKHISKYIHSSERKRAKSPYLLPTQSLLVLSSINKRCENEPFPHLFSAPCRIRTGDLLIKSQMLYQLS